MKNKYRVVDDEYCGYEAQVKYWWFPFLWLQIGINTSATVESARRVIERHKNSDITTGLGLNIYYKE